MSVLTLSRRRLSRKVQIHDALSGHSLAVEAATIAQWLLSIKRTLGIEFDSLNLRVYREPGGVFKIEHAGFELAVSLADVNEFVDQVLAGDYDQFVQ